MKKNFQEKGVVLIVSVLILGVLLTLGAYFLTFTLTESRISKSQIAGIQDYYLAEAGVNEAIWKLKNDPEWKSNFETFPWSANFSRSGNLLSGSSYQVQIQNSDYARGQIIATSSLNLALGKAAQRVVKTKVFKAFGSLTGEGAVFSGGSSENIDISASRVNIYDGDLFSNHNLDIKWLSDVNVFDNPETEILEGKVLVAGNLNVSQNSTLDATATCSKPPSLCQGDCPEGCPPNAISMPMVDFDSGDANSYKSKASTTGSIYTDAEFADLLWQVGQDGTLTLNNEVTYVTGSIDLKGGRRLVIDGVLVADGTVNIGEVECWTNKGQKDCGYDQITITDPGVGKPSGLLTKAKINFGLYSSFQDINITGLIYANDEAKLVSLPRNFQIAGGLLARKVAITSAWASIDIHLNNSIIIEGIWGGTKPPEGEKPPYSPVVTIEHWEESY